MTKHDQEWALRKSSPATRRFIEAVNELMRAEGLTRDSAWGEVRRRQPKLFSEMAAVNILPPGAELSADTQRLIPDWPVPPAVLGALGLPMSATREQYQIFKASEQVKAVSPEMAAKILVTLTRFQQLTQGMTFDETFAALKLHFPELFAAIKEAGRT